MNWKLKAHGLALLSRMPWGRQLYHRLQKVVGTNRLHAERDLKRAFELVNLIQQGDGQIEGSTCLEVGTGWRPFVPFVLALAGAKKVVTIDVNPWLTNEYARETWDCLEGYLPEIAAETGRPEQEIRDHYKSVTMTDDLAGWLGTLNIEYIYPGDARETGLPESSVDYVVSSNVLEHIPYEIQQAIHAESLRILNPGGLACHRFNPQDHYSTVDHTITNANFLQFSDKDWNWLGGSGLSYHNRLRAPVYRELFESAGFELAVCRERVDDRSLQAIQSGQLKIAGEFQNFTPEELAVDYMWMACRKPVPTSADSKSSDQLRAHTNS